MFVAEFHSSQTLPIVELFARDRWPGKRDDFFSGNYQAIEVARNAGYDLVVVGYLVPMKDDESLTVYTKLIDIANHITIWSAQTTSKSYDRRVRRTLAPTLLFEDRPDLFSFSERSDELARCTVERMLSLDEPQ